MMEQGRLFATWARNIVIKIPIINEFGESCLGVIHRLTQEGIAVNATAILSFNKAILAAKAWASYVGIFSGCPCFCSENGLVGSVNRNDVHTPTFHDDPDELPHDFIPH